MGMTENMCIRFANVRRPRREHARMMNRTTPHLDNAQGAGLQDGFKTSGSSEPRGDAEPAGGANTRSGSAPDGGVGSGGALGPRIHLRRALESKRGQMTVELAVAMPALIVIAVIAVNAMTFFSDCAVFDRISREAVRIHATAPAYRQGAERSCILIEQAIRSEVDSPNLTVRVTHGVTGPDFDEYTATLEFSPTLFNRGLRSEVFGVSLPRLQHTVSYVVDSYRAGVII